VRWGEGTERDLQALLVINLCKKAGIFLVGAGGHLEAVNDLLLLRHKPFGIRLVLFERVVFIFDVVENVDALLQIAMAHQLLTLISLCTTRHAEPLVDTTNTWCNTGQSTRGGMRNTRAQDQAINATTKDRTPGYFQRKAWRYQFRAIADDLSALFSRIARFQGFGGA